MCIHTIWTHTLCSILAYLTRKERLKDSRSLLERTIELSARVFEADDRPGRFELELFVDDGDDAGVDDV